MLWIILLDRIQQPQATRTDEGLHADGGGQAAGEPVRDVFDQRGIGYDEGLNMLGVLPGGHVDLQTHRSIHPRTPSPWRVVLHRPLLVYLRVLSSLQAVRVP